MARRSKKNTRKPRTKKKRKATAEELLAIARRFRRLVKGPVEDHATLLYDEDGLFK